MDSAAQVLVIIVSSALAVFLVAAIVLTVLIIQLVKKVKIVADHAEKAVETVTAAGEALKRASGPVSMFKAISTLIKQFHKS